jgi:hypothetical protein
MCSVTSIAAHIGKSEAWVISHWKTGDQHAYEWGVDPFDPADAGRRGKKICLQTHPDSAIAAKVNVDALTMAHWQENAAKLNAPRTVLANSGHVSPLIPNVHVTSVNSGSAMIGGAVKTNQSSDPVGG